MENGKSAPNSNTAEVNASGLTEASTKATGRIISQTVLGDLSTRMVTSMKVIGKRIEHMEQESIFMQMVLNMKEAGRKICSMGKEKRRG